MKMDNIEAKLKAANENLMDIDRASGITDPKPFYPTGVCHCLECIDGAGSDELGSLLSFSAKGRFHRVCFEAKK
jgi:hypothetical protein